MDLDYTPIAMEISTGDFLVQERGLILESMHGITVAFIQVPMKRKVNEQVMECIHM